MQAGIQLYQSEPTNTLLQTRRLGSPPLAASSRLCKVPLSISSMINHSDSTWFIWPVKRCSDLRGSADHQQPS